MAARTRTAPPGAVHLSQALVTNGHPHKNGTFFLPEKLTAFGACRGYPLAPLFRFVTKPKTYAGNGNMLINTRPMAVFAERMNMKKNRTRNNKFTLYLSDDEMRILNAKTKLLGMNSKAQLLRQLLIEEKLYVVDYKELHDYNIQLGRIGTNINQIAHRTNETRSIYQTDINEIKEEIEKIWQLQKSMLSKQPLRGQ